MFKTWEDLAKAVGGLASHFKKVAELHKAKSAAHDALSKAHDGHSTFCKAKYDGMDDGDANKAYFGKCADMHKAKAAHHTALAALHKAHAEHADTFADSIAGDASDVKAAAAAGAPVVDATKAKADGAAPGIDSMLKETTQGLVRASLDMLQTDPEVKAEMRKMLLEGIRAELGNKIIPDGVHKVLPDGTNGLRLVGRTGGPSLDKVEGVESVPPGLREMVEAN